MERLILVYRNCLKLKFRPIIIGLRPSSPATAAARGSSDRPTATWTTTVRIAVTAFVVSSLYKLFVYSSILSCGAGGGRAASENFLADLIFFAKIGSGKIPPRRSVADPHTGVSVFADDKFI